METVGAFITDPIENSELNANSSYFGGNLLSLHNFENSQKICHVCGKNLSHLLRINDHIINKKTSEEQPFNAYHLFGCLSDHFNESLRFFNDRLPIQATQSVVFKKKSLFDEDSEDDASPEKPSAGYCLDKMASNDITPTFLCVEPINIPSKPSEEETAPIIDDEKEEFEDFGVGDPWVSRFMRWINTNNDIIAFFPREGSVMVGCEPVKLKNKIKRNERLCTCCGKPMKLVCQIMPTSIYHLKIDDYADYHTVLCFACRSNECLNKNITEGQCVVIGEKDVFEFKVFTD